MLAVSQSWRCWLGSVLEAPALVSVFHDVAVMGEAVEERSGHLCVIEDGWPFAKGKVHYFYPDAPDTDYGEAKGTASISPTETRPCPPLATTRLDDRAADVVPSRRSGDHPAMDQAEFLTRRPR